MNCQVGMGVHVFVSIYCPFYYHWSLEIVAIVLVSLGS